MQIVYFFYPETANRTLEDLDFVFEQYEGLRARRRMEKRGSHGVDGARDSGETANVLAEEKGTFERESKNG